MYFNFLLLFKWASLAALDSDSEPWLVLFPGWHITDMVLILWAEIFPFVVKGCISLDFDDATLQKLLSAQFVVGSF